jgi:hypothetical protein
MVEKHEITNNNNEKCRIQGQVTEIDRTRGQEDAERGGRVAMDGDAWERWDGDGGEGV